MQNDIKNVENVDVVEEIDSIENTEGIDAEEETRTWRDAIYGKLNISLKTMDIIIGVLIVLLIVSLVLGVFQMQW